MSDEKRPVRLCESCLQVDDHPRHVLVTTPGEGATPADVADRALREASEAGHDLSALLSQIRDDTELDRHIDCCAADGCSVCQETLDSVDEKSRHGLALAKALTPKDV
jgi:hypothetical protein